MNNRRNFDLGDEIHHIVQDAVKSKDFSRLNNNVRNVVNGALYEVKSSIKGEFANKKPRINNSFKKDEYKQNKQVVNLSKITVPVGKVSGIVFTVLGSIGSIGFLITMMSLSQLGYLFDSNIIHKINLFIMFPCFIGSLFLVFIGSNTSKRLKRYKRYITQMKERNYCMIKDLSSATGRSVKYIAKDLQNMIKIGMFPQGHLDEKKTCFMINDESYDQYLKLQENMKLRDKEEQEKEESLRQIDKRYKSVVLEPQIRKSINEGRQYVTEIKNANIEILGEEISRKLDKLEEVTGKIFDYVETHPEKFPEIKKFTEYFLPTTLKLLDAYREFEYQPVNGTNISTAKKEIEDTMDTINNAFENLLDGLFEEVAMDISTDISVMETMLAQEGLSQKNIKK